MKLYERDITQKMATATTPEKTEYISDTEVKWEEGLREEMDEYGLDEQTIKILGQEGYIKKRMIAKLKDEIVISELKGLKIPSAQISAFRSMIQDLKNVKPVKVKKTKDIMMTDEHQAILLKCKPFLAENMKPEMVMEILHSKKLLTKYDRDVCNVEKIGYAKVVKLLDLLSQQTEGAFWGLIRALERTNQKHLANMIEECVSKEGRFLYTYIHSIIYT